MAGRMGSISAQKITSGPARCSPFNLAIFSYKQLVFARPCRRLGFLLLYGFPYRLHVSIYYLSILPSLKEGCKARSAGTPDVVHPGFYFKRDSSSVVVSPKAPRILESVRSSAFAQLPRYRRKVRSPMPVSCIVCFSENQEKSSVIV